MTIADTVRVYGPGPGASYPDRRMAGALIRPVDLDLLTTLVPLAIGTALVPVPLVLTVLLLRRPWRARAGRRTRARGRDDEVRLVQGVLFGVLFTGLVAVGGSRGPVVYGGLVVLAPGVPRVRGPQGPRGARRGRATPALARQARWDPSGPGLRAGVAPAGDRGLAKWVFTLGAIAAIGEAGMGATASAGTFVVFVLVAHGLQLALLVAAFVAPAGRTWCSQASRPRSTVMAARCWPG